MIYAFGDYELDISRREFRQAGEPLRIEPKVFDLLACLVQRHGHFISKEELHKHLWGDQFVSESALSYHLTAVRRAVGDNGRAQQVVKTVYGRGYRFIAPVEERQQDTREPVADPPPLPAAEIIARVPAPAATPPPPEVEPSVPPFEEAPETPQRPSGTRRSAVERRQLTVMWCRVVALPISSEALDSEDLYDVMQQAHQTCADVVHRFEGHIAQHLGNGLMVYFGYPQAHEDDAQRAIRTGMALVHAIAQLNASLEEELDSQILVRIGVHTGLVVMGTVHRGSSREQLALGDTPHIAGLLSTLAEPGMVVVGPATQRLLEGYFTCQSRGDYVLEELPQPLAVYQVITEHNVQDRLGAALATGLTPFVGRVQELGVLHERWEQVQDGVGQVVLLSGESGIGKSRLVREFQEHITEPHAWLACHCSPDYQYSVLYPVRHYVQQRLRWRRDDTPHSRLRKLEEACKSYGLPVQEVMPLFAALFDLPSPESYLPLDLSPQRQKQKTLEAMLTWVLKEAERHPVCCVVDDLHWADPTTLEFLNLLIDQAPMTHLLILLTARPAFQPTWMIRSHVTHTALNRLPRRQIDHMITQITLSKPLPAEVVEQLVAKTDGVPLFVEEMTKMVLDSGLVKEQDRSYDLVGPLSPLAIPSTLHGSLMARLDRLETGKQIAQLGAALGREFSYELIQAVAPMDEATLQQELACLVDAELLYQRGLPPQAQYLFKHALIQDVAYQSLLRSTRRQYHQQIAQVLEAQFPDIRALQPELLAHHYTEANLGTKAIPYWELASQYALMHAAQVGAIAHLERGLALVDTLPHGPERLQHELTLRLALGAVLTATKGYAAPEVAEAYLRARQLCEQIGDNPHFFRVLRGLWLVNLTRGELHTAHALGQHLLQQAEQEQDPSRLLEGHRVLGANLLFLGQLAEAQSHLEQGSALHDVQQHQELTVRYGQDPGMACLVYAAWVLWLRGYPDQGLAKVYQALALAQQCAHPFCQAFALTFVVMLHRFRREVKPMQEQLEVLLPLAQEHEFPMFAAMGMTFQGWALVEQGQQEQGIARIRQGVEAYQATGAELFRPYFLALLAEAYGRSGGAETGLQLLREALTLADTTGECVYEAELHRLQGQLLLTLTEDKQAEAADAFQRALTLAQRQQANSLALRAAMGLGQVWRQQGKNTQARDIVKERYGSFTEGLDTADLQEAEALLAAWA